MRSSIFRRALVASHRSCPARDFIAAFNTEQPEPTPSERLQDYADWVRSLPQLEAEREAAAQAEADELARASKSTVELLSEAINRSGRAEPDRSTPSVMPLNGDGVVNAVVAAVSGPGTTVTRS